MSYFPASLEPFMPEPLAMVEFGHARLEVWAPDSGHKHGHVRTVFPDGLTVTAAPNGRERLLDTALHEASHLVCGELLFDSASVCLRGGVEGHGRRWTDEKHREETAAFMTGQRLAELVRAMGRADT